MTATADDDAELAAVLAALDRLDAEPAPARTPVSAPAAPVPGPTPARAVCWQLPPAPRDVEISDTELRRWRAEWLEADAKRRAIEAEGLRRFRWCWWLDYPGPNTLQAEADAVVQKVVDRMPYPVRLAIEGWRMELYAAHRNRT